MISLLTNGWICYGKARTIINRYVLPLTVQIKNLQSLLLQIAKLPSACININQILDRNVNLKLTSHSINVKKSGTINIGVNKCSQG
jgi:hypothetical protein